MKKMVEYYPPVGFYFTLSEEGINSVSSASFQEAAGLSAEMDVETISEGGENRFAHRVPGRVKYDNLVLKRGVITLGSDLLKWIQSTIEGGFIDGIKTKNICVNLIDNEGSVIASWKFVNAYPIKWNISDLQAQENTVMVEAVEFAYNYFERVNPKS